MSEMPREPLHPPGMVEPETGEPIIAMNVHRRPAYPRNSSVGTASSVSSAGAIGGGGDAPLRSTSSSTSRNIENIDLSSEVLFNLTTCSICLDLFRDPKSLPCLHSFCKLCLFTLTQNDTSLPFSCPTCRRLCNEPVSALVDDFKGKLLVDTLRQRQREGPRGTSTSATASSSRAPTSQINESSSQQPVLCESHGNRRCEFFCEECLVAICVKCVSMEHNNHCYIDVFEDSHFLITEFEHKIEQVRRDIERLEDNSTDIDIMMGEFNFNIDERTRKLKKYVEKAASNVRAMYGQDLISKQSNITRKIMEHEAYLEKTAEYLEKLRKSVKDCAVFDIYADAKMHLDGCSRETPQHLFERPAKFEFSPCIEYQLTNAMMQFFGQPQSSSQSSQQPPPQSEASIITTFLRGLQQSSAHASNSSASGSARPHSSLGRVTTGIEEQVPSTSSTSSVPVVPPGLSPSPAGARRRRQFHISNTRRASPAVEALFSSISLQNQSAQNDEAVHSGGNPNSSSSASSSSSVTNTSSGTANTAPLIRTILPNASSGNGTSVSSDISVTHPLAPFFLSAVNTYTETTAAQRIPSLSELFNMTASDADSGAETNFYEIADSPIIPNIQNTMPQEWQPTAADDDDNVRRLFQSLMANAPPSSDTNSGAQGPRPSEYIIPARIVSPPPSSPAHVFNFVEGTNYIPTPAPPSRMEHDESTTDSDMQPERPFSPSHGAEETLL